MVFNGVPVRGGPAEGEGVDVRYAGAERDRGHAGAGALDRLLGLGRERAQEYEPRSKAADEVQDLYRWAIADIQTRRLNAP